MLKGGKPCTDLSLLARNRLWAWLMYCESGQNSWDALDEIWFKEIDKNYPTEHLVVDTRGRRRLFHRIFRQATDPASVKGLNGKYLLHVVELSGEHPAATALYRSELWTLLGRRELSRSELEQMRERLLRKLNLYQATNQESMVAQLVGLEHPAFSRNEVDRDRAIEGLLADVNADQLALLGCNYKVAIQDAALAEAQEYLAGIRDAFWRFHSKWGSNDDACEPLKTVMDARLVRMRTGYVDPESAEMKLRRRTKGQPPLPARRERSQAFGHPNPGRCPIVAIDGFVVDFTSKYERHYERALNVVREDLEERCRQRDDANGEGGWSAEIKESIAAHYLGEIEVRDSKPV